MEDRLIVRKIKDGTVIDHIPAGRALDVLKILGISGKEGMTVALVMNVESRKLGRKDIVKIENRFLKPEEVDKIALIAPTATINIVRDYEVVEKRRVVVPDEIVGILKCVNPLCISNSPREPVVPRIAVVSRQPLKLRCTYCDEEFGEEALSQLVSQ
ncbi:aspartate carbamoyltransferase regulatory subunit [Infirmifilum lucidum]|uniref:Aspartate carbamoyltransferase regulatory chain n=1 Tax=Infirmifilum lucidum TaxID=2776706 RepID=A0A7L9FJG4_9CREN|nr:aspartate carbamoyltransferase regulatory subunit [Infirmifilum lucidum]QOJ79163.1 aspartate carbamoyltransferase regulatory subunit [Infirmifilum lucidum]